MSLSRWFFEVKRGEEHYQFGKHHPSYNNIVGQRFGKLIVVEQPPGKGVQCLCDCGRTHVEKYTVNLRGGRRKSCGICTNAANPKFNKEEDLLIFKMAGLYSTAEIAEAVTGLGRRKASIVTIKNRVRVLKRHGNEVSLRRKGELYPHCVHSDADVELCRQLNDEGVSDRVIAEKMEINLSTVKSFTSFRSRCEYLNPMTGEAA